MKTLLLALALLCAPAITHAEDRVVVIRCDVGQDPGLGRVEALLTQGWSVKLVSSCAAVCVTTYQGKPTGVYLTFVLTRPDPAPAPKQG